MKNKEWRIKDKEWRMSLDDCLFQFSITLLHLLFPTIPTFTYIPLPPTIQFDLKIFIMAKNQISSTLLCSRRARTTQSIISSPRMVYPLVISRANRFSKVSPGRSRAWQTLLSATWTSSCAALTQPAGGKHPPATRGKRQRQIRGSHLPAQRRGGKQGKLPSARTPAPPSSMAKGPTGVDGILWWGSALKGVYKTYTEENLRYSQNAPLTMYDEGVNALQPARTRLTSEATEGAEYRFLCVVKGGGSANKTYFYQETKARIQPGHARTVPRREDEEPRHGGLSSLPHRVRHRRHVGREKPAHREARFHALLWQSAHHGRRDEPCLPRHRTGETAPRQAHRIGLGAQFGGKCFAHDVRVVRLPPWRIMPHRFGRELLCRPQHQSENQQRRHLDWEDGRQPRRTHPREMRKAGEGNAVKMNLNMPMADICKGTLKYPVSTRVSLNGTIIVARDIAHAKLKARLDAAKDLPTISRSPVLYAGPAKTPEGMPCGSMGPTTANRMDPYVDEFQDHGGSMVMIAKGAAAHRWWQTLARSMAVSIWAASVVQPPYSRWIPSRVSSAWSSPNSAWKPYGKSMWRISCLHPRGWQGQRLLQTIEALGTKC